MTRSTTHEQDPLSPASDYYQYQLKRIRPLVKNLGSLATLILLLMLPWDYLTGSDQRNLAMAMRMLAILQFYFIAIVWQKAWLEKHFVSILMVLGLVSYLCLSFNYILLEDHTPYLYTILFYFNLAFLVLAPIASSLQIVLVLCVPTLLMYVLLYMHPELHMFISPFTLHSLPLLVLLNMAAWYMRNNAQNTYELYCENLELASHDSLTGLFNRRAWENRSHNMFVKARREKTSFAVLLTDVDHFKKVNDTWGHPAGDEVLSRLAGCLSAAVREYDVVGRYGGEEFIISIGGMGKDQVRNLGERLRQAVEKLVIKLEDGTIISITTSVGIAFYNGGEVTLDMMIEQSDKAMYRAKRGGRNRVELHTV